jgi:hypothetical protein
MSQPQVITEDNLYELLAFLASSAYLCVNEPKLYGTFRLVDAACRLIDFALQGGQLEDEQFLRAFQEDANTKKMLLMTDEGAYIKFLEDATRSMAKELKNRATAPTPSL